MSFLGGSGLRAGGLFTGGFLLIFLNIRLRNMWRRYLFRTFSNGKITHREEYRRLFELAKPEYRKYIKNAALTLAYTGLMMYVPNVFQEISSLMNLKVGVASTQAIQTAYGWTAVKWGSIFVLLGILVSKRRFQLLDLTNRIAVRLRYVLYRNTLHNVQKINVDNKIIHHLITDIKALSEFLGESVFFAARGVLFLVGGLGCLIYYEPWLSVISVGVMGLLSLLLRGYHDKLRLYKTQENSRLKELNIFVEQRLQNYKLIRLCNTQKQEQINFLKQLDIHYKLTRDVSKIDGKYFAIVEGVGLGALFSVALVGSLLLTYNIATFSLLSSSTYALYVALGFRSIMRFKTEMAKMMGVLNVFEDKLGDVAKDVDYNGKLPIKLIDISEKTIHQKYKSLNRERVQKVTVRFQNISFKYHIDSTLCLLQNVNLTIHPGQMTAIVSRSGTGKSTLLNLLSKLYKPDSGCIYINNEPLNTKSDEFIQQNISYVTQDNYIFKGTFYSNVIYGNHGFDISEERVKECLRLAEAEQFVTNKGGIQGEVMEAGENLSGGEKQKLVLARALVKRPPILILDQATANIDKYSEVAIFKNLKTICKDSICIVISHKLGQIEQFIDKQIDFEKLMRVQK